MIYPNTYVKTADNTGVKRMKTIRVYNKQAKGVPGDTILVVVHKVVPHKKVKAGDKMKVVVVSTSSVYKRGIGFCRIQSRFNKIIFLKKGERLPLANRIHGKLYKEIRGVGYHRCSFISRGYL